MNLTGRQLVIAAGRQRAVVTEIGAALRSWTAGGVEVLDGFAADEAPTAFRGSVLAPWPNRLRDGRYRFGGAEHRTPVTEPERSTALHGLVHGARWALGEHTRSRVVLATALEPRPGYPFAVRLEVAYALGAGGLEVAL